MLAGIPLKGFAVAKGRLSPALGTETTAAVVRETARRVMGACAGAGLDVAVVTSDTEVAAWAKALGVPAIMDPGTGLDEAARAAAESAGDGWCVVHGDLPLIGADDLHGVAAAVESGRMVLAPSRDGGTNLVAGRGGFRFRFGPASFSRHLAALDGRPVSILMREGLAVELDLASDLAAAASRPGGRWLEGFLSSGR